MASGGGRGGRGISLLEVLRAQGSKPGSQTGDDSSSNISDDSNAPLPAFSTSAARGRGRGSLLDLLQQKSALERGQGDVPTRPVGRGRCTLLDALKRASISDVKPAELQKLPQRSGPSSSPRGLAPEPVPQEEESRKDPVIRIGESGKKLAATANYVHLTVEPGKGVYEYEVRFSPDLDAKAMRSRLLHQHLNDIVGGKTFDGVTLYLPIKLQHQTTVFDCLHPIDNTPVTMTIVFKRQKLLGQSIHLYNVLFRRIMNVLELARIGRQHFNPRGAHLIPQHKLEVWPGYVTAIDEYEGGIQLCCDSSHRVLRTQTVLELVMECAAKHPTSYRNEVQKVLIGCSVLTRYNNKTYRVDDIAWDKSPKSTFPTHSGEEISFNHYYKKQYSLNISDLDQPLLISRLKKKLRDATVEQLICLVPELCYMTGLTDDMRSDFRVMKDIATYTRITPNQRQLAIQKYISNIKECPKARALLAEWGLSVAPTTVELTARVVDCESITFGRDVVHKGNPQADWGASCTRNNVLSAKDIQSWLVVHTSKDSRFANDFALTMRKVGPQMGIQIADARMVSLRDDRTESYLRCLRENINTRLQVVVLICPTSRDDRYSAIKKLCCSEMPIASQVINSRTLAKPDRLRSVVQKIALQINCKLGGALWAVKIPFDNCMVCGIDSFHSASGRNRSVGGFVASLNQPLTRWYSQVCFQGPQQELIDGIKTCFVTALKKYYEVNHKFPDKIIIYRDGVGDGQLKATEFHEVPQFASCFPLINPEYKPALTVIVCQKRINTRIFATMSGSLENPPPGTIVDHSVTRRDWFDFFLVSQHVRQGTVTPTHYVVIHDSSTMKTDHIQRLTYKLCHLYYNWPGTVRVPAPCQYAHKLAYLVGQNINRDPSESLLDKLFFL